jgi:hypothetical protein
MRSTLTTSVVALALLLAGTTAPGAAQARDLTLRLSTAPPVSGVVSTRRDADLSLAVRSGDTVRFMREEGREERLAGGAVFPWVSVQSVPRDSDSVILTPTLEADGSVRVAVDVAIRRDDSVTRYSSTVTADPGEWVRLFGAGPEVPRGVKRYGTASLGQDSLFLRVDP